MLNCICCFLDVWWVLLLDIMLMWCLVIVIMLLLCSIVRLNVVFSVVIVLCGVCIWNGCVVLVLIWN